MMLKNSWSRDGAHVTEDPLATIAGLHNNRHGKTYSVSRLMLMIHNSKLLFLSQVQPYFQEKEYTGR